MLKLPNVTLIALTSVRIPETIKALEYSCKDIQFGEVKLASDIKPNNLPEFITHEYTEKSSNIDEWNYNIIYKVLNTSEITDIPQHRERIYIVCVKNKKIFNNFNLDFKKVKKQPIKNMLSADDIDDKYYYNNDKNKIHKMVNDSVVEDCKVYQFRRIYVREKHLRMWLYPFFLLQIEEYAAGLQPYNVYEPFHGQHAVFLLPAFA